MRGDYEDQNGLVKLLHDLGRPDLIGKGLIQEVANAICDGYVGRPPPSPNGHSAPETVTRAGALRHPDVPLFTRDHGEWFRSVLLHGDELDALPRVEQLVEDLLQRDSLALLYGPSGTGKTFVAMDIALAVARGAWWFGRPVHQGPVLYTVAEGASGLPPRIAAWKAHNLTPTTGAFHVLPAVVNITSPDETEALATIAAELGAVLVVVDTLNRCMPGCDENSSKDMGQALAGLETVRLATHACVLTVHHTGKDTTAGARGHSSLRAAVETELEVREGPVLKITKQRNGRDDLPPERFTLTPIADSVALTAAAPSTIDIGRCTETLRALAALDDGTGLSMGDWRRHVDGIGERAVYLHRKRLVDDGYVRNIGTSARPRYTVTTEGLALLSQP